MASSKTIAGADEAREQFQPIPIRSPADHPLAFRLRRLVDLQLDSTVRHLRPALAELRGDVVDIGAGESPWRDWLPSGTTYTGLDVAHADDFRMQRAKDIVYYDGTLIPFANAQFDAALCIEVLEHAEDPGLLLREIARVLKEGGTLLLTVPWSARRHHIPHDYHRFTRERLARLAEESGFVVERLLERGSDIGVIANKLVVLTIRLLRPRPSLRMILSLPLGIVCGGLAVGFLGAAHVSQALGMGAKEDPLGYFLEARRSGVAHCSASPGAVADA